MNKLKYAIIILGAVLASTAPFIHMCFPPKNSEQIELNRQLENEEISYSEYKKARLDYKKSHYFGFGNARIFLRAIGQPITIFCSSIIMLLALPYIHHHYIKRALLVSSFLLFFISTYFLIWCFYPRDDLPKVAYYVGIGVGSLFASFIFYYLIIYQNRISNYLSKIKQKKPLRLPKDVTMSILTSLDQHEKEDFFLTSSITIHSVADKLNTNSKYLSHIINTHKKKPFTQYVNALRIDYIKRKLEEDPKFTNYTIKALANEGGFNTSTAFSKAFVKRTGQLPSEYMKKYATTV